jgi:hypothetical protein
MLVAWADALAVLKALSEPRDAALREGLLFLSRGGADQLGLDLDPAVIHEALLALEDAGYIEWANWQQSTGTILGLRVTGRGMQALGEWPLLETIMNPASLAQLLDDLAPYAADAEKEAVLRRAAQRARPWVAGTFRESVIALGNAWARSRDGIGGA